MHIGIIQYKNKIIYVDLKDNRIYGYYYNKRGKQIISSSTILSLINSLFNRDKEVFFRTENEYKIYINKETGYKHFYKNKQQDILKFFLENGKNAIMYDNENSSILKKVKEFYNKHQKVRFILNFVVIYSTLMATDIVGKVYNASEIIAENKGIELSIIEENYDCYFDYHQLCQSIQESLSLSNEEKENLYNEDLFNDICATPMSIDRIKDLEEKITDVEIVPFTEQDYQEQQKKKDENDSYSVGYYNPLEPNILHVDENQSYDKIEDTKYHEFIHLLQDDNKYYYIKEASAEIISNEYYGAPLESYTEEAKRIKALMEIIGSNSILSILYNNMYKNTIEKDENIKKIYDSTTGDILGIDRSYFKNCNLEDSKIVIKEQPVTDAIKENTIDIDFYKTIKIEITEEAYQEKQEKGEKVDTELYIYDNPEVNEYVSQELSKIQSSEEMQELEEKILNLGYGNLKYYSIELSPISVEEVSSLRQQGENITYNINYITPEYSTANIAYSHDNDQNIEIPVVYFQKEVKLDNFKSNPNNRNLIQEIEASKIRQ